MKYKLYNIKFIFLFWKGGLYDCSTIKDYLCTINPIKLSNALCMLDLRKYDSIKYDLRIPILRNIEKVSHITMYGP